MGTLERLVAGVGLALSSPAMAVSAAAIKASSPGPVLFRAERMGRAEVPFTMYKLRTMHQGAQDAGSITGGRDPRIFRAGKVLRSLKLDEIPQLVNVVRGQMSFFGPRPEAIDVVEKHYAPWMMESLKVPPGIVGPGSLGYFLGEDELPDDPTDAEQHYARVLLPRKIARELVFVRRRTLAYRLELLVRTLLGIVKLHGLLIGAAEREERAAAEILRSVGELSSDPTTLPVSGDRDGDPLTRGK
ncbi:sugar transferase [Ornithinimicrobium cerasi]|uniref:sugar transferase n=1 Tax=Ornithinimicrobium cerasi TaxID=2248773 RepID=UPI001F3D2380|nr:sugar transferase [Ornithinimicrobium cerasi]